MTLTCSPYGIASAFLVGFQQSLALTRAGVPQRMAVYPHTAPAFEFCNMGWVGFGSISPDQPVGRGRCGVATWKLTIVFGVVRCYPVMEKNEAPPEAYVDSAARDVADDFEAMRRAVTSVSAELDLEPTFSTWTPINPQGGAHGSRFEVSVSPTLGQFSDEVRPMLPGDPRG